MEIAGLQSFGQMDEDADLERAPVDNSATRPALDDKVPPPLRGEAEVDLFRQIIATGMAVGNHDRQGIRQAAVLGCRADVHQIEQPEQQAPGLGVDRPKQRQVIVAVPGGNRLTPLRQRVDTALLGEKGPDPMPGFDIGLFPLGRLEHLAEDGDQGLLHLPVLILEGLEPLLGSRLGPADPMKKHFDQFIAAARSGLPEEAEKQGVTLARAGHAEKLAHFQGGGFGGELAELGVGDPLQDPIRVDKAGQPVEPVRPQPDRLGACGTGCLLETAEGGGHGSGLDDQQGLQRSWPRPPSTAS